MRTSIRMVMSTAVLAASLLMTSAAAQAQDAQACQPGIGGAFTGPHTAQYQAVLAAMVPVFGQMSAELAAVVNQATYQPLLTTANTLAASLATGRVVVTLPDGTVMIDTARDDNTVDPRSNSYQHFVDKTINENHNSRLSILGAQEYACGIGLESKLSSSTGQTESYVAIRVGQHLDSLGTIRMSVR